MRLCYFSRPSRYLFYYLIASRTHLLALVPEPLLRRQCQKFFTAVLLRPGSSSLAMAAATKQQVFVFSSLLQVKQIACRRYMVQVSCNALPAAATKGTSLAVLTVPAEKQS